jgi:hypothetical protein
MPHHTATQSIQTSIPDALYFVVSITEFILLQALLMRITQRLMLRTRISTKSSGLTTKAMGLCK